MEMPRSAAAKQKMMEAIQRRDEHVRAHAAASLAAIVANGVQIAANGARITKIFDTITPLLKKVTRIW
jgi:hypothetical protein